MTSTRLAAARANAFLSRFAGTSFASRPAYHHRHRVDALKALQSIEHHSGTKLPSRLKALADDYAADVLGGKQYAPWLYVYSLLRGSFQEGWIPDNYFGAVVLPRIHKDIRSVLRLKTLSNLFLRTELFPDIGYYIDGLFYNRSYERLSAKSFFNAIRERSSEVYIKEDRTGSGQGILKLDAESVDEETFAPLGNCVVQTAVQPHAFFDQFVSGPVATIRVLTAKEPGGNVSVRASYLRLGRKDAAWIRRGKTIRVAVVSEDGDLDGLGYANNWKRWSHHPDTDVSFSNKRIPKFKDFAKACVQLHTSIPHLQLIGWDVAVGDDERIHVLESNGFHPGIKFPEAVLGPSFSGLNWERFAREASKSV